MLLSSVSLKTKHGWFSVEQCDFVNENLEGFELLKKNKIPYLLSSKAKLLNVSNEIHQH